MSQHSDLSNAYAASVAAKAVDLALYANDLNIFGQLADARDAVQRATDAAIQTHDAAVAAAYRQFYRTVDEIMLAWSRGQAILVDEHDRDDPEDDL